MVEFERFFQKLARSATNEELEIFQKAVDEEIKRREEQLIKNGNYVLPLPEELSGEKVKSVITYRQRTGYTITLAKRIVDKHWPK